VAQVHIKPLGVPDKQGNNVFDNDRKMGMIYSLVLMFRPRGKADIHYLSGFADCIAAVLKRDYGAIDRKFEKTPDNILVIKSQVNSDEGSEEDVCQFLIDVVEKSSMQLEDFEMLVDGRKISVIDDERIVR
jgi:hypothetical protein